VTGARSRISLKNRAFVDVRFCSDSLSDFATCGSGLAAQQIVAMTALEQVPLRTIDGNSATVGDYAGKVRLIVNVASRCGLTPQYEGLEALYRRYRDRGFEVLAFPANEFGAQEPGTDSEIKTFCSTKYDVTFPLFSKIVVKGPGRHPLYNLLTEVPPAAEISWNFEKFLIDRQGNPVARFSPQTTPDSEALVSAIERELAK
jgi:glutathione peroxidase